MDMDGGQTFHPPWPGRPLLSGRSNVRQLFLYCNSWSRCYDVVTTNGSIIIREFFILMRPAFVIHLWLPLFAISSLIVKLIYPIFRAVEWAQWFLKQGDAHPLKTIGIVATIIVFGSAMLVKEGWALLGVLERI
jgi:hypothetical protein